MPRDSSKSRRRVRSPLQQQGAVASLVDVLTQLGEGIMALAGDGTVTFWNQPAASLTGYSAQQAKTQDMSQVFTPSWRMVQMIEQATGGVATAGERLTLRRADGLRQLVTLWCLPLLHLSSAETQILVVMRALPPAASDASLAQERGRLGQLGQLADLVSHTIYNPLNAIFLHLDVLAEEIEHCGGDHGGQLQHSLSLIRSRLSHLYELLQGYLTLARLPELPRQRTDLGTLLAAVSLEMHEQLRVHDIILSLEDMTDLGEVALHTPSLERALGHVVQWAIEAMPQGGAVTVRGQRTATHVQLDICVAGREFRAQQLAHLRCFSSATFFEDSALGLYFMREIVTAHQGEAIVTRHPQHGVTFTIRLPLLAS